MWNSRTASKRNVLILGCSLHASACGLSTVATWDDSPKNADGLGGAAGDAQVVDRWKELIVDDPSVLGGARSSNEVAGAPWSFRSQLEWISGDQLVAPVLARGWLEQWDSVTELGDARAPVTPRPGVEDVLLQLWGRQARDGETLPLERAPFHLLAIVNRLDLVSDDCTGTEGELRYVYGAEDPVSGAPLEMTVNVEVPYPAIRSPHEWALAWHRLAREKGEVYAASLDELTRAVRDHVDPAKVRVRSNERAFAEYAGWELREFRPTVGEAAVSLKQVPLDSTPREDLRPDVLAEGVSAAFAAQQANEAVTLPIELRAGAASLRTPDFVWSLPELRPNVARAFSQGTCNGCHGGETEALPFQHISASSDANGTPRLSQFLNDPAGGADELGRREQILSSMITINCAPKNAYH